MIKSYEIRLSLERVIKTKKIVFNDNYESITWYGSKVQGSIMSKTH